MILDPPDANYHKLFKLTIPRTKFAKYEMKPISAYFCQDIKFALISIDRML